MAKKSDEYLSKREGQIMDAVYRRKKATVAEICEDLPDIPNYTAARVLMHLLEDACGGEMAKAIASRCQPTIDF